MAKKLIEVEGGEIAIKNSYGDIAIIPKDKVSLVKRMLKNNCNDCIDRLIKDLPKLK